MLAKILVFLFPLYVGNKGTRIEKTAQGRNRTYLMLVPVSLRAALMLAKAGNKKNRRGRKTCERRANPAGPLPRAGSRARPWPGWPAEGEGPGPPSGGAAGGAEEAQGRAAGPATFYLPAPALPALQPRSPARWGH